MGTPDRQATGALGRLRRILTWQPQSLFRLWAVWTGAGIVGFTVAFLVIGLSWLELVSATVSLMFGCAQTSDFGTGSWGQGVVNAGHLDDLAL